MSELIDNRTRRIETLKQLVRGLSEGQPLDAVRSRLKELVRACDASDVTAMEQQLLAEGISVRQLTDMCDVHSHAVRDLLVEPMPELPPGHPVDTFFRENAALREQAAKLRTALAEIASGPKDEPVDDARLRGVRAAYGLLMDVDKHYLRKEHLLFPFLEKRGITGPSSVMWAKHDEARALLKRLGEALAADDATAGEWRLVCGALAEPALGALEEMIVKEERILLPMSLRTLAEQEWGEVAAQSPQIGYCLVDPRVGWQASAAEPEAPAPAAGAPRRGLVLPSGSLSLAELESLFATLPVDLTFVDADDRVRFFSEGPKRVFHRAKAVIGRKVQHCHPPASVATVDRILRDFRTGAQSVAEFWIEMRGRFLHIRYFALRDAAGAYLGTLEVTQDLTHERALSGERRLLQYES